MNRDKVIASYESFDEDSRAYGTPADQLEFIYTKRLLDHYIEPAMSVVELGCATGYYGLYLADRCRSYHGVDLTPKHIEQFQAKIDSKGLSHVTASVGDATHLPHIADNSYDAVLVFGPMYHLPPEERQKVFAQSKRICKPGGLILLAYINQIGAYLRACLDDTFAGKYPNLETNRIVLEKGVDDMLPDVFFFTMPEQIERDAASHGLTVLRNAGLNFVFRADDINGEDEDKRRAWGEIMDRMFESPSCTGVSNHAILVCRN